MAMEPIESCTDQKAFIGYDRDILSRSDVPRVFVFCVVKAEEGIVVKEIDDS